MRKWVEYSKYNESTKLNDYPRLVQRPSFNVGYYVFYVAYNFFAALQLALHKENCLTVLMALNVFNIGLHIFPSCLNNYDLCYLIPNWLYFSEYRYFVVQLHVYFCLSKVIQVFAICLLYDTFLFLRSKNNFDRSKNEQLSRNYQREIHTPHTHYMPRGLQNTTEIAAYEGETALKPVEKDVYYSSNYKINQSIYVVDI